MITKKGTLVSLKDSDKKAILNEISLLAKKGLRTLAFSYKKDIGILNNYKG
jgi:hypothetical protein